MQSPQLVVLLFLEIVSDVNPRLGRMRILIQHASMAA